MSNIELIGEYEALSKKLDREGAMFTAYEWNMFLGRHTDLGMELSNRDYWSTPTWMFSRQQNEKTGTDSTFN